MRKNIRAFASLGVLAAVAAGAFSTYIRVDFGRSEANAGSEGLVAVPAYDFSFPGTTPLKEAATRGESTSADWWLRAGGSLRMDNGTGRTLEGNLPHDDFYRLAYAVKAPAASDNGYHPQNIFRLISQRQWKDFDQSVTVKILNDNLLNPENSYQWNAISLLERYQDEGNYYYAGVRMDGAAVIKKKRNGQYYTLALKQFFWGSYDRFLNPNILPKNTKLGLKTRVYNSGPSTVVIELYVDQSNRGDWKLAARAVDSGYSGGSAITAQGYTGIYSDFMDLELSAYKVSVLQASGTAQPVATTTAPIATAPATTTTATTSPSSATTTASTPTTTASTTPVAPTPSVSEVTAPLAGYGLSTNMTIKEAGSMSGSASRDWWVNSGGYFYVQDGIGKTVQGRLADNDEWRLIYAKSNPTDTENGYQPQNIFRLVTRTASWRNHAQETYFKINNYNTSSSPNREGHNGVLFFVRYKDGNNLYYAGLRVDGKMTIKKKINGAYHTLAMKTLYPGTYNRTSNPNLLPTGAWIGMRVVAQDNADGTVNLKLYVDKNASGNWTLAGEATDDGKSYGGPALTYQGSAGLRTDFMDVEFKGYSIKSL